MCSRDSQRPCHAAGVLKEVAILTMLQSHSHFPRCHAVYELSHSFVMLLDAASGGEVLGYVLQRNHLTQAHVACIMRSLLQGLEHMHGACIAHG